MGGGYVTRPDFNKAEADPSHPLTEIYALLQKTLSHLGRFDLPGAYIAFAPPEDELLYEDTIRDYCSIYGEAGSGCREALPPGHILLLYDDLSVAPDGSPAALLLTEEGSRKVTAVQLLPPFPLWDRPAPPPPDCARLLTLQLTPADLDLLDAAPARLGADLARRTAGKRWLAHPAIDRWMMRALAVMQKEYHRRYGYGAPSNTDSQD